MAANHEAHKNVNEIVRSLDKIPSQYRVILCLLFFAILCSSPQLDSCAESALSALKNVPQEAGANGLSTDSPSDETTFNQPGIAIDDLAVGEHYIFTVRGDGSNTVKGTLEEISTTDGMTHLKIRVQPSGECLIFPSVQLVLAEPYWVKPTVD